MYHDMQHIGSQARYARPSNRMLMYMDHWVKPYAHVYGSLVWIMYHDMYHDVQQMGLQARSTRTSGSKHHLYGPYELAGPIWIMYCDMENMGSQARYASCTMIWRICARISADMHHVL